jgi:hypothetical protein
VGRHSSDVVVGGGGGQCRRRRLTAGNDNVVHANCLSVLLRFSRRLDGGPVFELVNGIFEIPNPNTE